MKYKISVHYENKGILDFYKEFEEEGDVMEWLSDVAYHECFIEKDVDNKIIFVNKKSVTGILIDREMENTTQEESH